MRARGPTSGQQMSRSRLRGVTSSTLGALRISVQTLPSSSSRCGSATKSTPTRPRAGPGSAQPPVDRRSHARSDQRATGCLLRCSRFLLRSVGRGGLRRVRPAPIGAPACNAIAPNDGGARSVSPAIRRQDASTQRSPRSPGHAAGTARRHRQGVISICTHRLPCSSLSPVRRNPAFS